MKLVLPFLIFTTIAQSLSAQQTEESTASATFGADTSVAYEYFKERGYVFYETSSQLEEAIEAGELVMLNELDLYDVVTDNGPQYVRPTVATFIRRLSQQYRNHGCGKIVVNRGHDMHETVFRTNRRSLHASGTMIDITAPTSATNCLWWLEDALLSLEEAGRIDASKALQFGFGTSYHITVYIDEYQAWLDENT